MMNPKRNTLRMLPCLMFLATLAASTFGAEGKLKVLIVTGFDVGAHKWRETTPHTQSVLVKTGRFDVQIAEGLEILESPTLSQFDVVVLNYGFWKAAEPSAKGKAGLLNYVKSGGGLVSTHFACSSFQEWKEYRELLGSSLEERGRRSRPTRQVQGDHQKGGSSHYQRPH